MREFASSGQARERFRLPQRLAMSADLQIGHPDPRSDARRDQKSKADHRQVDRREFMRHRSPQHQHRNPDRDAADQARFAGLDA